MAEQDEAARGAAASDDAPPAPTTSASPPAQAPSSVDPGFEQLAGVAAIASGVVGVVYALAFVVLKQDLVAGLGLLFAPLLATPALIAVYRRVRGAGPDLALWALAIGFAGSLGAIAHGGYNLANAVNPRAIAIDIPFQPDPRGLFTFGLSGLALFAFAWLAGRTPSLPRWVEPLGYVLGAVLVVTYLGRLIVLDATSPLVLGPALLAGVLSPVFYLALGWWFLREP